MNAEVPPAAGDPESDFTAQARAAGIVLPKKSRADPWEVLVIVVALLVLTAGIGQLTGWVNLRTGPATNGGGFQTQSCAGTQVVTVGSVSSAIDPEFTSWLGESAQEMDASVGGCFDLEVNSTPGDGYVPPLGGGHSEFAATYATPTAAESRALPTPIVVVPVSLTAIAVVYNLPGVPTGLNLTAATLAGIYLGTITSWDAPVIAQLNPGASLAGAPSIAPVHISGETVANDVVTQYLARGNSTWNGSVGQGLSVAWPTGAAVATDAAMLAEVSATPGAIGYLQIFGAPPSGVGCAELEDIAGGFVSPNAATTWAAATSLAGSPAVTAGNWSNFSLEAASAAYSYPLSVLSYLGIYRDLGVAYGGSLSVTSATWLLTFVYWLTTGALALAPLPSAYATEALGILNNETYDGTPIVHLENENGENGESGGETGEF
ncbi:MAG: substrate-binding domain-containing protein, partial [Thermoplasmata archaeon]